MKKYLLAAAAAFASSFAAISVCSAQAALFIYNDGNGVPNAGTYTPGSSFTFSINLGFVPGGSVVNLESVDYWFQQTSPSIAPFPFAITLRSVAGSMFTDLQTPSLTYPQNLNPSNNKDLGASLPGPNGVGAGTYFIADITVSIPTTAPDTGTFVISNTITGGNTSTISDSFGDTLAIPEADYTVTMTPEPSTWAAGLLTAGALLCSIWRRRTEWFRTRARGC